ncbi:unnamed protein product [Cuscuta europaea]|uniref:Transposase (putative) gypsy type domain-containing protein n=1 Tax=Cuscuta europaea TaxID=41803 RepID=A0A9P1DZ25_CUSEU|nr:unnamed protein product [Cuscuta europaea]
MSSASDSQDISGEPSVQSETWSDEKSASGEASSNNDSAVAVEVQSNLRAEAEAECFEQEANDEELAIAIQTIEEEEEKERQRVTVAILSAVSSGAGTSRALRPVPLRAAPSKKKKTNVKASPRKKQAAADARKPIGIPEGYSFLNIAALALKTKADKAEYHLAQFYDGPSATVIESGPNDVLSHAPEGCFVVHMLSVTLGLRFPLHPFLVEYLNFVKLARCQLTPNNHSYIMGFLHLCRSSWVTPTLDLFFQSFNLCRGGHTNSEGFTTLQQIPEWRLFSEVPSSHKGRKDRFCYIRMAENPFPGPLRDNF